MLSLGQVLERHRNFGPGFDFLRVALATMIIAWHTGTLTGHGDAMRATPAWILDYTLVPAFFMLSGFLVAGSGLRLSTSNFLINRAVRIVPALAADIFFAALIIGPLMTTVPLLKYFTSRYFFTYFFNITGWIHYLLPGVFLHNPTTGVNGALWTVPYEIGCYAIFTLLMLAGIIKRASRVAILLVALLLAAVVVQGLGLDTPKMPHVVAKMFEFAFVTKGARLWPSFLLGVLIYLWRFKIPYNGLIALGCAAVFVALAFLGSHKAFFDVTLFHVFALPLLAYITVWVGLTPMPYPAPFKYGDYSYGLYLYHAPFLQTLIVLMPWLARGNNWPVLFVIGYPIVFLVAVFSWHIIEKPVLRTRKKFSFAVKARELEAAHPTSVPAQEGVVLSTASQETA